MFLCVCVSPLEQIKGCSSISFYDFVQNLLVAWIKHPSLYQQNPVPYSIFEIFSGLLWVPVEIFEKKSLFEVQKMGSPGI